MTLVGLQEVLAAREQRAGRQAALIDQYGAELVCFSMNIAGPEKRTALIDRGFLEGKSRIEAVLQANAIEIMAREQLDVAAGQTQFWCVRADAVWLKMQMAALEQMDPLARLFDIDVIAPSGLKISRQQVGLPPRICFLCQRPAHECGRSRRHTVEQLQTYTDSVLHQFFTQRQAQSIGTMASRALLYEVSATPKPGLVDRWSSGAHTDMDFFTFLDSICSLEPYFIACAGMGLTYPDESGQKLLWRLRPLGAAAEQAMLKATGGVNTHKGAIFSLGLLCAAAGSAPRTVEDLCHRAAELGAASLKDYEDRTVKTGGGAAFYRHQITGVRGEAASGFSSVRAYGLPAFQRALQAGKSLQEAGLEALVQLLCQVEDTNAIKRTGRAQWQQVQQKLRQDLHGAEALPPALLGLDRQWTQTGVSPGGCADLLAVTYFLHFWSEQTSCETSKSEQTPT